MNLNKSVSFSSFQERLHSFSLYPLPSKETSCMKLAEAGFERQPNMPSAESTDEVYCSVCGLKCSAISGKSPWVVHRTLSPNCLFLITPPAAKTPLRDSTSLVNNNNNCSVFSFGNSYEREGKIDSDNTALAQLRRKLFPMYDDLSQKMEKIPEIQHPFLPKRGDFNMLFESLRLLTFNNPLSTETATYAKAGFVYDHHKDCAVCVFCNLEVPFTPKEKIFLDFSHKEQSSSCPFIRDYDVGNVSREDECCIRENARNTLLNASHQKRKEGTSYSVKHPEYDELSSRSGTFKSWPALQASEYSTEIMAECGFYFTNFGDSVRCFSCGIGLRNWAKGSDPFSQHAKASPHCLHILDVKGQHFIDDAQLEQLTIDIDHRETEDSKTEQETAAITSSSTPPSSSSSSPSCCLSSSCSLPSAMTVGSPLLDLDAIRAATACQYSIEQIADAVIRFFVSSSGRYPNKALLLGTLRAADVNYKALLDKHEEIIKTNTQLLETKSQLKAKDSIIEATKSELTLTQQWKNIELQERTELKQVLEHKDEMLHQKDEVIHHKDEVIQHNEAMLHQNREVIQNNAIQLELKNREVEDLLRQLKSVQAALQRKEKDAKIDDTESEEAHEPVDPAHTNQDEFPVANCKVCLTNTSQIVFYPCKHLCCCDACATRLVGKSCPICREPNLTMEKVYVI